MARKISVAIVLAVFIGLVIAINHAAESRLRPDWVKQSEDAETRLKEAQEMAANLAKKGDGGSEPGTVDVSHILIRVSGGEAAWAAAKTKIDAVRARVLAGEDFATVAIDVSEDPSVQENGGAFLNTPRGTMVPEFDAVAFAAPVGEVSEPFRTQFGWHIIKVTARRDAAPPPAQEVAGSEAPDVFKVKFRTSKGDFVIECRKEWAPNAAARFHELAKQRFFDDARFFRVVKEPEPFVVQWGISSDPNISARWRNSTIPDDPVKQSNTLGMVTFAAGSAKNSRSTQIFVNLNNNSQLDGMGFAPFGKVIEGLEVINALNGEYGETPTSRQGEIMSQGIAFLRENFPNLDYVVASELAP